MKYSGLFLLTLVKLQFHFYREMVGWRTCFISLNGDLFRTISHVLLFTVFPYTPIGIGQYTVSLDVERRGNEDMVDAAFGKTVRIEIVESTVERISVVALLGRIAEDLFGSKAFLVLYILSGLMGNLFVMTFSPEVVAAGASTALFGIFGAIASLRFIARSPYIQYLSQSYTSLILVNILFSFMPGISLAGHLGGLVGGGILAFVFPSVF